MKILSMSLRTMVLVTAAPSVLSILAATCLALRDPDLAALALAGGALVTLSVAAVLVLVTVVMAMTALYNAVACIWQIADAVAGRENGGGGGGGGGDGGGGLEDSGLDLVIAGIEVVDQRPQPPALRN